MSQKQTFYIVWPNTDLGTYFLRKLTRKIILVKLYDTIVDCNCALFLYYQFVELLKMNKKQFHIVGISMGGGIAGIYCARYPEHVDRLTLVCPACTYHFTFHLLLFKYVQLWNNLVDHLTSLLKFYLDMQ